METLSRAFLKTDLADDDDWTDPSNDPPPDAQRIAVDWPLAGPVMRELQVQRIKLGVTFRDGTGAEVAGTFDVDVVEEHRGGVSANDEHAAAEDTRSSWKKIGVVTEQPSNEALVLDVGGKATIAVRLYNIDAATAEYAAVDVQHWGAS